MTPSPAWRSRMAAAVLVPVALFIGVQVANGSLLWPMLLIGVVGALLLGHLQPLPLSTVMLGVILIGYIVGNRGFAQLMPAPNVPLLPAEAVLLLGGSVLLFEAASRRQGIVRRDALNLLLLVWVAAGSLRIATDFQVHRFFAVRDYALVYYTAFFFLAQRAGADAAGRRFLHRCLLVACGALLLVHPLFANFQEFFLSTLTVRDVPLIFFKGDLVGTFLALGSLLYFIRAEERRSAWSLAVSLVLAGMMLLTSNRASMLGLIVAAGFLALGGRWRFAATLGAGAVAATLLVVAVALVRGESWQSTVLYQVYEQVVSVTDPFGERVYTGEETFAKGDNNAFRTVWWSTVIDETWRTDPWFGLGWGHNLGERFAQIYYPQGSDEFSARSPHNVFVTVFGRTGLVGLLAFTALVVHLAIQTLRAVRGARRDAATYWCGAWIILTSACFGVVLEGPMGAVVFWTLAGLAHAAGVAPASEEPKTATIRESEEVRPWQSEPEVANR